MKFQYLLLLSYRGRRGHGGNKKENSTEHLQVKYNVESRGCELRCAGDHSKSVGPSSQDKIDKIPSSTFILIIIQIH